MHGVVSESLLAKLIEPEIKSLLAQRSYKELRESLQDLDPVDLSEILIGLTEDECAIVFRLLPKDLAADVFAYMPLSAQEELIQSLNHEQVAAILNEMDPDDRTALLEELPAVVTKRLIGLLKPKERAIATTLLGYPEYSVGRMMTPEYVSIRRDWTVEEVLAHIRKIGQDKETINILYVVDEKDRLIDDILLRTVIFAEPYVKVTDLMNEQFVALNVTDDQETAAEVMRRYDISVLPVVDSQGTLLGIVTSDDVFDVLEEEVTEDIHRMGGLEALEEPYSEASLLTMVKKRGGWLSLLFVGGMFTVWAMEAFDSFLKSIPGLSVFIPLIISSGGNSGSQASTLVIRALATQDIELGDWSKVIGRELATGILMGIFLGFIAFLRAVFVPGVDHYFIFGLTICLAVVGVVLYGTLVGCMLPFILRNFNIDPALSSAPLVATLVDVTGIIIYCTVAKLVLQ